MSQLDEVIDKGSGDPINQTLRQGASLNIRLDKNGKLFGQPYIQSGLTRYYFATDEPQPEEEFTRFTLKYDGWERSVGHLNITLEDNNP